MITATEAAEIWRVDKRVIYRVCQECPELWKAEICRCGVRKLGWILHEPPTVDPVMLPADVARILGVSHELVIRWCKDDRVKAFRVGSLWRIYYEDGARLIFARKYGYRKAVVAR